MNRSSAFALAAASVAAGICLLAVNATAAPNNVTGDDCSTLFAGSVEIPKGDMTWSGGDGDTYVTVWTVDPKWFVSGFVVKGGNAYNTFSAGDATNMTAPNNASGGPADVSHWFGCGIADPEETTSETTTTTVETTTETTPPDTTTTTTEATTTTETTTQDTTTTTESTTSETTTDTTTSETTTDTTSDTTTSESTPETTTSDSTTSETTTSTATTDPSTPITTTDSPMLVVPTDTSSASGLVSDPTHPDNLAYTGRKSMLGVTLLALVLFGVGVVLVILARRPRRATK